MKRVSIARASRTLAQYTSELKDEIVVIAKGNRPVAALVPLEGSDRASLALSTSRVLGADPSVSSRGRGRQDDVFATDENQGAGKARAWEALAADRSETARRLTRSAVRLAYVTAMLGTPSVTRRSRQKEAP